MKKRPEKLNFNHYLGKNSDKSAKVPSATEQASFDFILLTRKWSEIVGEQLFRHTLAKSLRNNTLTVLVRHSVFAVQLKSLSPIIIKKIEGIFPSLRKKIKKIHYVTSEQFFIDQDQQTQQEEPEVESESPFDPNYAQKKWEAGKIFDDLNEEDIKELFISLYTQRR